jgi:N-acetylmuramoyl-L-alanine amidase
MIPKILVIHHSVSSRDKTTIKDIDAWHKLRWPDFKSSLGYWVGYHYVILGSGEIVQTRKDNEMGAHCIPNDDKIGICLTGNFMVEKPSDQQISSLERLTENLKKEYGIEDVKGHRELSKTDCPGDNLFIWVLQQRISFIQKLINYWKKLLGK